MLVSVDIMMLVVGSIDPILLLKLARVIVKVVPAEHIEPHHPFIVTGDKEVVAVPYDGVILVEDVGVIDDSEQDEDDVAAQVPVVYIS